MKDKSIFESIKELGEFRLYDQGAGIYKIFVLRDRGYHYLCTSKLKSRSNKSLYEEAKSLIDEDLHNNLF